MVTTNPMSHKIIAELNQLREEIAIDVKVRNDFITELSEILGECPDDGPTCMPHLIESVRQLKNL